MFCEIDTWEVAEGGGERDRSTKKIGFRLYV